VNLPQLDLNLLLALEALLGEGSVGRAARRLHLSQPAVSHALKRLRDMLDDPLLVRAGSQMELTPRAERLRAPLADILQQVRTLVVADTFDPTTSTRRFRLMGPDHVFDLVLPLLLTRIRAEGPDVRLDVGQWTGRAFMTPDLARSVDLVLSCATNDFAGFYRERLYSDTDAIAVRRNHPDAGRVGDMEIFTTVGHVAVIGYGQQEDMVDPWLAENGVTRRIELVAPSYLQALHLVAQTDLIAVVPRRQIEALTNDLGLLAVSPPLDPGNFDEFMFFPTRLVADPGALWLRAHVREVARTLGG
jgi:DNA-binding transcriptional LysR family regulator